MKPASHYLKYDYPAVRAWADKFGSHNYYVSYQVKKARLDKAPADATYEMEPGKWATIDDIRNLDDRPDMAVFVEIRKELNAQ